MKTKSKFIEQNLLTSAVLSTVYKTKNKDNIDLLIPFVEYSIGKLFIVGNIIDICKLSEYLQENFTYNIFPQALIVKILNRIVKKEDNIKKENKEYKYVMEFEKTISKFEHDQKEAYDLIENITKALNKYLCEVQSYPTNLEKTKIILLNFLDKYGIFTYSDINRIDKLSYANERENYYVGKFVIEQQNNKTIVFNELIHLVQGFLLSRAIYLQTYNGETIKSNFKNIFVFSDTSLLLCILGLKSKIENDLAKEFNDSIPENVKKVYFSHTIDEIEGILRKYIYNKNNHIQTAQTIEFFDENNYTEEDVNEYINCLSIKLRHKGFYEWENNLDENVKECETFDENKLKEFLKENIPAYTQHKSELMLDNDIKSLYYIKRLRHGKNVKNIENCKAIFVTSNFNLVLYAKKFFTDIDFNYIISYIDFIVLLWLKDRNIKEIPKDILVANAIASTQNVGENFLQHLIAKIKMLQAEDDSIDSETINLLVENNYMKREFMQESDCNIDNVSSELVGTVTDKYRKKVLEEENINNTKIVEENKELKKKLLKKEEAIQKNIEEKATKIKNFVIVSLNIIKWVVLLTALISGVAFTVINIIQSNLVGMGYAILIIFGIWGILDACGKCGNIVNKLIKQIGTHFYNKIYSKEIEKFDLNF